MKEEDIELYIGEDILQGEKEIPFYVLWKNDDDNPIRRVVFSAQGFEKVVKMFNVEIEAGNLVPSHFEIDADVLMTPRYIGGLLAPQIGCGPYQDVKLEIVLETYDGIILRKEETRTIFSTKVIGLDFNNDSLGKKSGPLVIGLTGSNTVFIDIAQNEDSEIVVDLPADVKGAYEKFAIEVLDQLALIRPKYPEYHSFFDLLYSASEKSSFGELTDELRRVSELISKDKMFLEDLSTAFTAALTFQMLDRSSIMFSLFEYFESRATTKAFLMAPLLSVKIPKGKSTFSARLVLRDILGNSGFRETPMRFDIYSEKDLEIPLKEFVRIQRDMRGNAN